MNIVTVREGKKNIIRGRDKKKSIDCEEQYDLADDKRIIQSSK